MLFLRNHIYTFQEHRVVVKITSIVWENRLCCIPQLANLKLAVITLISTQMSQVSDSRNACHFLSLLKMPTISSLQVFQFSLAEVLFKCELMLAACLLTSGSKVSMKEEKSPLKVSHYILCIFSFWYWSPSLSPLPSLPFFLSVFFEMKTLTFETRPEVLYWWL